ncbi:ABC transporter permease [Aeromonas simiae]|uniref:ABC transporter permease n=1 Tax=Aeromonas simiae TaxID=218936 RepID=UPI0005A9B2B5|nr:ABC transporter permease [Aeromonas simiae]MDO2946872.1 ABC transporter permease [Aeromonas simiae]MDO2951327.1 ABC transporter permease [Aeromonas simiae]MDO2954534.1 ABC transporter permease [Aeromonas simiae]
MQMPVIVKILLGNKKAAFGLAIVVTFVLMALFAPLIASHDPTKRVARPHQEPSAEYVMGTTRMGRDIWSQFVHGGRVSLLVGFGAGLLVCVLAVSIGITAGYFGGVIDEALTFLMNVVLVIPNLPLLLVLASFIGEASPWVIALIIGLTSWAYGARVIRAQTLALREKEFVIAAEVLGEPAWRIILVEILPNLISIIGVSFIGSIIYAIVTEATLEFLGLGDPLVVSWGIMLYNAQTASALLVGAWWEVLFPCLAIATLGAGLALLNFAIDEIANPQLRSHKGLARWKRLAAPLPEEKTA